MTSRERAFSPSSSGVLIAHLNMLSLSNGLLEDEVGCSDPFLCKATSTLENAFLQMENPLVAVKLSWIDGSSLGFRPKEIGGR